MIAALVSPRPAGLAWPEARRSWVEVGLRQGTDADRLIRYATVGVGLSGVYIPLIGLHNAALIPIEPGHMVQLLGLYALVGPPSLWLLLARANNDRPRGRGWVLAAIAVVTLGALPVVQADWIRGLYLLTALVLVQVRPPWAFLAAAALAAMPAPLAIAFGHTNWAGYFTLGLLIHAVPLAVLVWLAAEARELRDAREQLAREAVIRERLRIDHELRRTLGVALETIAVHADRAGGLAGGDPAAAAREVGAVTDNARDTLAEARRMVTRFQAVSLRAELDAAAALLSAAGIQTRVDLPQDGAEVVPEPLRSNLRAGTARLLGTDAVRECVITVHRRAGRVELDMSGDGMPVTP